MSNWITKVINSTDLCCTFIASIFFKNVILKNLKKIEQIYVNFKNWINLFKIKKNKLPDYLLTNHFVYQFFNNFLALLLCKINAFDFFDMGNFFLLFFCYIVKYWNSDRIKLFCWECTSHASLNMSNRTGLRRRSNDGIFDKR